MPSPSPLMSTGSRSGAVRTIGNGSRTPKSATGGGSVVSVPTRRSIPSGVAAAFGAGGPNAAGCADAGGERVGERCPHHSGTRGSRPLVREVAAKRDGPHAEDPGQRRERGRLEAAVLQAPVESVEEVDRLERARGQHLAREVGATREPGSDRLDRVSPAVGREARPGDLEDRGCRGCRGPSRRIASVQYPGTCSGRSTPGRQVAVRHTGSNARSTRPTIPTAPASRTRTGGRAATAAAISPAIPSTTMGTTRGVFRSASPIEVALVNERQRWPYGVESSYGHAPTPTIVPTMTHSGEVRAVTPADERAGEERQRRHEIARDHDHPTRQIGRGLDRASSRTRRIRRRTSSRGRGGCRPVTTRSRSSGRSR